MFKEMNQNWDLPLQVSLQTARLIQIAPDGTCQRFGTRDYISKRLETLRIDREKSNKTIFCFGGSTTFGHGVNLNETWPKYLEGILDNTTVINCGIVKNDLKASLHTFVDTLREGNIPNQIIFFDGVNESSGFRLWDPRFSEYIDYDTNYKQLSGIWNTRKLPRVSYLLIFIFGKSAKPLIQSSIKNGYFKTICHYLTKLITFRITKKVHENYDGESPELIYAAAESYVKSKKLIQLIAKKAGIEKMHFFLQPSVYDVPGYHTSDPRKKYMSTLYKYICEMDPDVIDLSSKCGDLLNEEMFFDWQHLDSKGNNIIAEEISKYLQ